MLSRDHRGHFSLAPLEFCASREDRPEDERRMSGREEVTKCARHPECRGSPKNANGAGGQNSRFAARAERDDSFVFSRNRIGDFSTSRKIGGASARKRLTNHRNRDKFLPPPGQKLHGERRGRDAARPRKRDVTTHAATTRATDDFSRFQRCRSNVSAARHKSPLGNRPRSGKCP